VTSDVGQHQMWAAQFYKFDKPRRWINFGGLGTMGFGLPAAMGVQFANPGATVACVTGEASIQMCIQELSTCKQYRLPIKIVNLNNKYMGHGAPVAAVSSMATAIPSRTWTRCPTSSKLAESYGQRRHQGGGARRRRGGAEGCVQGKNDLVFLDFVTDQTENVYPMVQGGKGLTEMILAEEL